MAAEVDDMRQTVANMVMRLSTLEGRQRALQGKMAKLDSAWGGDASQMSLAIAELQHVVAQNANGHSEFGSLRGQLIALAVALDKLDKRTTSIERRIGASTGGSTDGGGGPPQGTIVDGLSPPSSGGTKASSGSGKHHHQSYHHH